MHAYSNRGGAWHEHFLPLLGDQPTSSGSSQLRPGVPCGAPSTAKPPKRSSCGSQGVGWSGAPWLWQSRWGGVGLRGCGSQGEAVKVWWVGVMFVWLWQARCGGVGLRGCDSQGEAVKVWWVGVVFVWLWQSRCGGVRLRGCDSQGMAVKVWCGGVGFCLCGCNYAVGLLW